MKLGRPLRGLSAVGLAALASVPLTAAPAFAAPAAPAAYTAVVRAYPLYWASSGSLPVADLRVPYVSGSTNHLAAASAKSALARPDLSVTAMSADAVVGLSCAGYDEQRCVEGQPFLPDARAEHSGIEAAHREQLASFGGKEGKFPGRVRALTDCAAECGKQLVRTTAEAAAAAGSLGTYINVGSSAATQEVSIDDKGRLVALARSELRNVSIGPKAEIRFSSLTTSAQAFGTGVEGSKDGRAELRVTDFVILDNPVELTRDGLRLASGAPSEQEAYDGAKALLGQLKEQGITLELPDFAAQLDRQPGHVTVKTAGLRVRFDRSVEGPQGVGTSSDLGQVLDLGSATAIVAAFDQDRQIDVSMDGSTPVVAPAPTTINPPPSVAPTTGGPQAPPATATPGTKKPTKPARLPTSPINVAVTPPSTDPGPVGPDGSGPAAPPGAPGGTLGNEDTNLTALPGLDDVTDALGLRGAHAVSNAFGAFLGLGLILPLARIVIRRLG